MMRTPGLTRIGLADAPSRLGGRACTGEPAGPVCRDRVENGQEDNALPRPCVLQPDA